MNSKVSWFSAGVSSFIATYLVRDTVDKIIYIDIDNQHPDSMRFVKDSEKVLGKEIEILKSPYGSVDNVIEQFRFISSAYGAKCTEVLKKRVRKEWEYAHRNDDITYIWGMDFAEKHRADNICEAMSNFKHEFPIINHQMEKQDCHAMCDRIGPQRPIMYDLGYQNNNCIGCVKGGMGYWNKIRIDFPDVFAIRAAQERKVGHSCINGIYLDELKPDQGRIQEPIVQDCGVFCQLGLIESEKE